MTEAVEHAEIGEDAAADHDIFDQSGIEAGVWGGRSLGMRLRRTGQDGEHQEQHTQQAWVLRFGGHFIASINPDLRPACAYSVTGPDRSSPASRQRGRASDRRAAWGSFEG